jgi:hypothetical protein
MQSQVATVLGIGDAYYGYGQTTLSSPVSSDTVIDDVHMNRLRDDIRAAYIHQNNVEPIIGSVVEGNLITEPIWIEYEAFALGVFQNAFNLGADQYDYEVKETSERRSDWGGENQPQTIYHEFEVVFESKNQRRAFFNAGGEIQFRTEMTSGVGAKSTDWIGLLASFGIVRYSNRGVEANAGTLGLLEDVRHLDLPTDDFIEIFSKIGSGFYVNNKFSINAKQDDNKLIFSLRYYDGEEVDLDGDEPVTGRITSLVAQLRPTGEVEVESPVYVVLTELE